MGTNLCASDITVLSRAAKPPQIKPKELDSRKAPLGSFACAPLVHPTLRPRDSCTSCSNLAIGVAIFAIGRRKKRRLTSLRRGSVGRDELFAVRAKPTVR